MTRVGQRRRNTNKSRRKKRLRARDDKFLSSGASVTTSYTDAAYLTALDSEVDDNEMCDFYDSDTETLNNDCEVNSEVNESNVMNLEEIDRLLEGTDVEKIKAYGLLLEVEDENKENCDYLWRLAKACHSLSVIEGLKKDSKKEHMIQKGIEYAEKALKVNEESSFAHKWYAICLGSRGPFVSMKQKIIDGFAFRDHVQRAIKLNPEDPTLHFLLARFEFEVASLSWVERKLASTLFAEIPKGSVESAIKGFAKSEELNPKPWKENRLMLAKCYLLVKDYKSAASYIKQALQIPAVTSEEEGFDRELKEIMKNNRSYLNV